MITKETILAKLKNQFGETIQNVEEFRDDLCVYVDSNKIVEIAGYLKNDHELKFNVCEDITAIDWAKRKERYTIVYHLFSLLNNFRLRIKTILESDEIDSVSFVWESANWYERETFDMYGIKFRNHPDLRRMYLPEDFEYFPLRKEFPLMGIPGAFSLPKK